MTLIRAARPGDETEIVAMVRELAEFEEALDQCSVTEIQMCTALFGPNPVADAFVVEVDGAVAAMAVWFVNFSTWAGVGGVYLEDLYVRPAFRRRGLARALLSRLAQVCLERGYTRLSWAVLNWNTDAITLYDAVGGVPQSEWTTYRVSGRALTDLAGPA
ncbi:N-acetyltransferase GCN5 [Mycolicibacterium insubricum]|jgi:GNAT superfamily N-acetyltransferase|uniref:GNAT family N-acetyltransferase n=1 Tax=Mycolicibacterium insubricum TaxID=444597 RepID=A0A1X0DE77_9MYCO|nr:GNAT family N-acetyltransferase [Mycolicibacterium insubricum]MCB9440345.1 GNAT family N-acetyltransferase [Mycolicibacterium sp.]MCV7080673.1 GNAT family N-acetyltransferase [Mycolicibacterium insubricum]ORA70696.1 GNAT family N-acetyltransferase [Mycolicibacterium insubricum]BBZ66219.1 N-acetyltransferase GCN5 [Mycolicibacterium insubricum]